MATRRCCKSQPQVHKLIHACPFETPSTKHAHSWNDSVNYHNKDKTA